MSTKFVFEVDCPVDRQKLKQAAEHVLAREGVRSKVVVILSSDETILRLNTQFLEKHSLTDVLSFPWHDKKLLGEVYVCVSVAERSARELSRTLESELILYIIHGILHLTGYDDTSDREFKRMHRREDELLGELGYPPAGIGSIE